jgi:hypothetical protein
MLRMPPLPDILSMLSAAAADAFHVGSEPWQAGGLSHEE